MVPVLHKEDALLDLAQLVVELLQLDALRPFRALGRHVLLALQELDVEAFQRSSVLRAIIELPEAVAAPGYLLGDKPRATGARCGRRRTRYESRDSRRAVCFTN